MFEIDLTEEIFMNNKSFFLAVLMTFLTLGLVAGIGKAYINLAKQEAPLASTAAPQAAPVVYEQPTQAPTEELPAPTATLPVITPGEAATAALKAAGEGEELGSDPELVMFNGESAYEVKMKDASIFYVSANDGSLKYNSITGSEKPVITSDQALVIAADYINYYQPVSIALNSYNNTPAYFIRFWNGANVYVDRAGNILAIQYVKYTSSGGSGASSGTASSGSSSSGGGSSSSGGEEEHDSEND
jgi:uncharacterized membrane protein YgcG